MAFKNLIITKLDSKQVTKDEPIGMSPKKTEFWLVLFTAQRYLPLEVAGLPHHDVSTPFDITIVYFFIRYLLSALVKGGADTRRIFRTSGGYDF